MPLFSIPSTTSWGIGEIGDIESMTRWLGRAGQCLLQLLPINETPPGERSPYSALSAMAIDPQFISMRDLEDFAALGGEAALDAEARATIDSARAAPTVDYAAVRSVKPAALRRSFAHFRDTEWASGTRRAAAFQAFCGQQSWWLDDYSLFRALHAHHGEQPWMEWPVPVRDRHPDALAGARAALADDVLFRQWLQWVAADQWSKARERAGRVALFGDLPFMVAGDSADVWARQDEFRLDVSVGVPPDAFSEDGQDWGLPAYRWDVFAGRDFDWLRRRARRNADLFDGFRVDHLVGFYRTYFRERTGDAGFTPPDEPSQENLGEQVLNVFLSSGADIVAEDLGVVPDFVRASLDRLGVAGYKVLRWERHWNEPAQPFIDPAQYSSTSVATSGTHDTEPMAIWWEAAPVDERSAVLDIPAVRQRISVDERHAVLERREMSTSLRDALLESLYGSGSDLLILPIQDVFGWSDRINTPATIGGDNWTWRLPWAADRLTTEPQAIAVADRLREWSDRSGRCK